jgi:uncharacterized protein (TIGR03067 family)
LIATILLSIHAYGQASDELKGDLKAVQGTWTAMVGPNKDIPIVMTIEKSGVSIQLTTPEGQELTLKGEITLDESKSPKQWDWKNFTLPDGTTTPPNLAIYELKGDELTLCSGGPEKDRPTEFKDDPSGMPNVVKFARKKAEEKKAEEKKPDEKKDSEKKDSDKKDGASLRR